MGRIGFQTPDELKEALSLLKVNSDVLLFEGIFTHFATADSPDDDYFKFQYQNFKDFMSVVDKRPRYVHVANSATSLWHQVCDGNMIRYGISAYGLNPSGREITKLPYALQPALSLTTELTFSKLVKKGRSIGYGATYTADSDQWIGRFRLAMLTESPVRCRAFLCWSMATFVQLLAAFVWTNS